MHARAVLFTGSLWGGLTTQACPRAGWPSSPTCAGPLVKPHRKPGMPLPRSSSRMTVLGCCPASSRRSSAQTYQVEQTVAVDTGSRDRSGAVLAELIGQDAVFGMDRPTGYGEAVAVALRHATRRRSGMTDPSLARVEWIWLLHDDCEPAPDALEQLLRAASKDRTVVVVGPKVLDGQDRRTLREVGVSIDRAGRRVTGHRPGRDRPGPARPQARRARRGLGRHARPARRLGPARRVRPEPEAVPRRRGLLLAGPGGGLARAGGHRRRPLPPGAGRAAAPARRGRQRRAGSTGATRCTCWPSTFRC